MDIILGGGLAGLIVKFYNSQCKIITKDIGGQFTSKFQLGPRFLHCTPETQQFVLDIYSEFGIEHKKRVIKVGYWYDGALHDSCSAELMKKYFLKSRGLKESEIDISKQGIMSSGKNQFDAFEIDYKTFAECMFSKYHDDFWIGSIETIDLLEKSIACNYNNIGFVCEYDNLISTIPLNVFLQASQSEMGYREKLRSSPIRFYKAASHAFFSNSHYDYIYCPNESEAYYRATISKKDEIILEYCDDNPATNNGKIMTVGHVIDTDMKFQLPDVTFIGRMAKWKHNERLEKVVKDAQDMGKSISIQ